ncbi:MAG: helix-turn-helix transcriptional regulator [Bacilli bacterium]|nr:helix-turn-helix transcriptional regulator [Bacilli bacterium]
MELREYLEKTNTSVYVLSKKSGVPYSTTLSICRGKANIEDCRLGTLRALAKALDADLMDLIDGNLKLKTHRFIDDSVDLNVSSLPLSLRKFIAELEEYDREGDVAFYAAADTMLLMADRLLKSGAINSDIYEKLARKYPIGE